MNPINLSHAIEHGMVTYRGLPAPVICDFLSREASRQLDAGGTEFHIGRIDMVANFRFFAVPAKVRGFGTLAVRAFAICQP